MVATEDKYALRSRFSIVIEDLRTDKGISPLLFKPIWTLRRAIILILGLTNILVANYFSPIFQSFTMILTNFLYICYIIRSNPFYGIQLYVMEVFNSIMVYSLSVLCLYYLKSDEFEDDGVYITP